MTTSQDSAGEKPTISELQADIEQTRAELGDTVGALTAKMDVKTRTKERLSATKDQAAAKLGEGRTKAVDLAGTARDRATTDEGKPTPQAMGGAGALVALVVGIIALVIWRRQR